MSQFSLPQLHDSARWNGLRIGLLGGSFNPPHEGHVHISLAALKGLELDAIWWLVTPQNPLKKEHEISFPERVQLSRDLVAPHSKILVTDMENDLGTTKTYDTVRAVKSHFPQTEFVWITGMDNALTLHTWHRWQDLLQEICMVHIARNPASSLIQSCPLRMLSSQKHVTLDKGGRYPLDSGITYWMLQKQTVDISSTELRLKQHEKGQNI